MDNLSTNDYREIPLTRGMVALVDEADYDELSKFKWHAMSSGKGFFYAVRTIWLNKKAVKHSMAKQIMQPPQGRIVDHRNHNTLDNRRCNLRIATYSENLRNTRRRRGECGFRGVTRNHDSSFCAQIKVNGKRVVLGYFQDAVSAALAYDEAARLYYDGFEMLNFPTRVTDYDAYPKAASSPLMVERPSDAALPELNAALSGDGRLTGAALPHEAASDNQGQRPSTSGRGKRPTVKSTTAGLFVQSQGAAFNRTPSTPMGHTAFGGSRKIVGEEA